MKKFGYTIAEILISLALIGIVVAVTLPTFVSNYRRQACASALSVAVSNFEKAMTAYIMKENATDLYHTTAWRNLARSGHLFAATLDADDLNGFAADFEGLIALTYLEDSGNFTDFYGRIGGNINQPIVPIRTISGTANINVPILFSSADFGPSTHVRAASLRTFQAKNGAVYFIQFNTPLIGWLMGDFRGEDPYSLPEDAVALRGGSLFNTAADVIIDVNGRQLPNTIGRDIFKFDLGHDGKLYPCGGLDYALKNSCRRAGGGVTSCSARTWRDNGAGFPCTDRDLQDPRFAGWGCTARVIDENYRPQF